MNHGAREIDHCEVCSNCNLVSVLDLGLHPMCDDLVSINDSRISPEFPIEILFCKECLTAHQRYQVPKQELFPESYHYRSRFTADVLNGMAGLVDSCIKKFGSLSGKKILDIGCNDGSLLDIFREKGAVTIGIEPTGACKDAEKKGHSIFSSYLSVNVANEIVAHHGNPDFITFTNVFAHIENLNEVLDSLKALMAPQTVIIIENHYLGSVLDGNQFDTFYHEHPRTYSYNSFVKMAESLGLSVLSVEFPSRYGGNIRVIMGDTNISSVDSDIDLTTLANRESRFFDDFRVMNENIQRWQESKKAELKSYVERYGSLRAKAFPGRAAILIKILELDSSSISAVYEKPGSLKIGNYLPGTRIPIKSDDELFVEEHGNKPLLNLAWHIPNEIRSYLTEHNFTGEVIDILKIEDFE